MIYDRNETESQYLFVHETICPTPASLLSASSLRPHPPNHPDLRLLYLLPASPICFTSSITPAFFTFSTNTSPKHAGVKNPAPNCLLTSSSAFPSNNVIAASARNSAVSSYIPPSNRSVAIAFRGILLSCSATAMPRSSKASFFAASLVGPAPGL